MSYCLNAHAKYGSIEGSEILKACILFGEGVLKSLQLNQYKLHVYEFLC